MSYYRGRRLDERFPRVLTFITRCGCTKTRYEAAGSRSFLNEILQPLEVSPSVEYLRGDMPSEAVQRTTYYHRSFVLEQIRFDQGSFRYELIYRERGR